jgi:hypothetical protein
VEARRGEKTAVVALARKMLGIIHHILVNCEPYVEEGFKKKLRLRTPHIRVGFPWRVWLRY